MSRPAASADGGRVLCSRPRVVVGFKQSEKCLPAHGRSSATDDLKSHNRRVKKKKNIKPNRCKTFIRAVKEFGAKGGGAIVGHAGPPGDTHNAVTGTHWDVRDAPPGNTNTAISIPASTQRVHKHEGCSIDRKLLRLVQF